MNTAARSQQLSETGKHKMCDTNEPTDNAIDSIETNKTNEPSEQLHNNVNAIETCEINASPSSNSQQPIQQICENISSQPSVNTSNTHTKLNNTLFLCSVEKDFSIENIKLILDDVGASTNNIEILKLTVHSS